jgi:large subunit ribosomal protein L29
MKVREIREMKTEEEKNMIDLRFSHQLKQLTNTAKLNLAKKDIARMKTILKEKQLAEQESTSVTEKEGAGA